MAESKTIITTSSPPPSESENTSSFSTTTIAKTEEPEAESETETISLRIWPPTQTTREAVVKSLIETLSTESMFSNRYEALRHDDAIPVATSIEEQAYGVASAVVLDDDDYGFGILAVYSKEISKLALESVKSRPADPVKLEA